MDNLNEKLSNEAENQPSCLGAVSGSVITHRLCKKDNQENITCLCCELTSYNTGDVKYLYCAFCDMFHNDHPQIKSQIIFKNKEKIWNLKQSQQRHSVKYTKNWRTKVYSFIKTIISKILRIRQIFFRA